MHNIQDEIISTISYTVIERVIESFTQKHKQTNHEIILYADRLETVKNIFPIEHVLDISYKPFSGQKGLFYLHTNQGVFTFEIQSNPNEFIHLYKKMRSI